MRAQTLRGNYAGACTVTGTCTSPCTYACTCTCTCTRASATHEWPTASLKEHMCRTLLHAHCCMHAAACTCPDLVMASLKKGCRGAAAMKKFDNGAVLPFCRDALRTSTIVLERSVAACSNCHQSTRRDLGRDQLIYVHHLGTPLRKARARPGTHSTSLEARGFASCCSRRRRGKKLVSSNCIYTHSE